MDGRQQTHSSASEVHPAVRVGLIALIESDPRVGGINAGKPGREAMDAIAAQLEPFLHALSEQGRSGSGLEVQATLAVLHCQRGRRSYVGDFVEAGPALIQLLRQAAAPGMVLEGSGSLPDAAGSGAQASTRVEALAEPLSEREREVLTLLATGLSNKDLAAQLFVSVGTVKQHLHHINGKLGTTSRTSALARARAFGLL